MLNRTVSDARLSLLPRPQAPTRFIIACLREGRPIPMALHGTTLRLFVSHEVDAVGGVCHTVAYTYTLQSGEPRDSWLVRWEFQRERPAGYPYPLGHLHVNADPATNIAATKPFPRLHLPTARVAFELVVRHAIAEWGVRARSDDWADILDDSVAGFEQRRSTG